MTATEPRPILTAEEAEELLDLVAGATAAALQAGVRQSDAARDADSAAYAAVVDWMAKRLAEGELSRLIALHEAATQETLAAIQEAAAS